MFAFLDTPFDRDHPVYTRANAGEILPDPVSPLAWSIIGPGFEEGFRISLCDDFSLLPRPGLEAPYRMVGRMAARFHLNLTVLRIAGDRLPGTSADVVDLQYFGDAAATGLPAHPAHPDDRRFRLKAPPSMGRTLAGIGRRVGRDRATINDLDAEYRTMARTATDEDLVWMIRRVAATFGRVLGTHVTARALTSPILEQAVNALERAGIDAEAALSHVSSIPDLQSAKPSRELAAIARTIPPGSDLADVVATGSFDAIATSSVEGAAALSKRLTAFLADHGHRGVGEFDPTNAAWEQRPDDVVVLLRRLREKPPVQVETPEVDPGRVARPLVAAARSAMARAERTKDTCMRSTNLLRRLVFELGDRMADDLPTDRYLQCTIGELEAATHGAGLPAPEELARRAEEFERVSSIAIAEWSDGAVRVAPSETTGDTAATVEAGTTSAGTIEGIAGSPGIVEGRVRVVQDPYTDFAEGDILVASMTDTAWTPLFLVAGGVVTDVGGVLSHATIVARDLGVPAVVNTKIATRVLADGDTVRVDGGTGRVTVLERA